MTPEERANLVLAFARVLFVNGQSTEQTVAVAERLGDGLGLRGSKISSAASADHGLGFTLARGGALVGVFGLHHLGAVLVSGQPAQFCAAAWRNSAQTSSCSHRGDRRAFGAGGSVPLVASLRLWLLHALIYAGLVNLAGSSRHAGSCSSGWRLPCLDQASQPAPLSPVSPLGLIRPLPHRRSSVCLPGVPSSCCWPTR